MQRDFANKMFKGLLLSIITLNCIIGSKHIILNVIEHPKNLWNQCIKTVLRRACVEKRLTVGLLPAIQYLSKNSNRALFCVTAEAPPGDSATHMQEVLLQAFCVENDIYVIKVDSETKLRKLLGCCGSSMDFSCVLVHYPYTDPFSDSQEFDFLSLTDSERDLIEHCELNWGYSQTPVIKLPEK